MTKKLGGIFFAALTAFLVYRFTVRYYFGEVQENAIDFPSYYHAAKLTFEQNKSPYIKANWNIAEEAYKNETGEDILYPFLYPPPSLLFFRLFTLLEYEPAKRFMLGLNHWLTLVFIPLFFFGILKLRPHNLLPIVGTLYLYNFFPLILTLYTGQINLLILLLILFTWLGIHEKWKPFVVALPLALSIVLKLYPILFFVIFFIRREYKVLLYTLFLLIVISAVSTPFLPHNIWLDWIENVASKGYLQDLPGVAAGKPANQSVNALLVRTMYGLNVRFDPLFTLPDWIVRISPYIICGLIGSISLAATWLSRDHKNNANMQFGIWLTAMFLIAPFSWDHHLVLILPAIFIAIYEAWNRKLYIALPVLLGTSFFLALNFNFNNPSFREGWRTLLISAKLYAVAIVWLFFVLASLMGLKGLKSEHQSKKWTTFHGNLR